ncbi:MAG: lasso RiPP family leader peptide-containing protein [Solirubrobacteraceae bacterium]
MNGDNDKMHDARPAAGEAPAYERPEVIDFGTLQELTLSGTSLGYDSLGAAGGAGS